MAIRAAATEALRRLRDSVLDASPWAWTALASVAALSLIDVVRDRAILPRGPALGVAPNFVGVFALSFAWLTARRPRRAGWDREAWRPFSWGLGGSVVGLVAWEFLQLRGNLVFDPADLVATLAGAAASVVVFLVILGRGR